MSNALFRGGCLPTWVKKFPSAEDAINHAKDVITDHHERLLVHVAIEPVYQNSFYLIAVEDRGHAQRWLEEQGFLVLVV